MKKLKLFLPACLLLLVLAFTGCQSKDEASLENKEVFEEELSPVSDEEMAKLEAVDVSDEEMTMLDEEELGKLEGTSEENAETSEEIQDKEEDDKEEADKEDSNSQQNTGAIKVEEAGSYTSKDEVAVYIHTYGKLPSNYITKKDAKALGWVSKEGNLDEVAPGKSIGGDKFGNYEGMLPKEDGRQYYECDIDLDGTYRNEKRINNSDDGLIFYTEDHYETFEQLN